MKQRICNAVLIWLWRAVIVFEIALLVYYNLFHMADMVDCDLAKLMSHVVEMARNHTLFVPGWSYGTTGEMDCSALMALPLYLLTGNIYLSFALSNIVNISLWMFVLYKLCQCMGLSANVQRMVMAFVFTAYDLGMLEYTNMLFIGGGQYTYKALIPLMVIVLLQLPEKERRSAAGIGLMIVCGILVFITGLSSSLYVFACGILPIMICSFLLTLHEWKCVKEWRRYRYQLAIFAGIVVLTCAGCRICSVMQVNPNSSSMKLRGYDSIFYGLEETINSLAVLFHGRYGAEVSILSHQGVRILIDWILTGMILVFGGLALPAAFCLKVPIHSSVELTSADEGRKAGTGEPEVTAAWRTEALLTSVFVWNFMVLLLTQDTARYHLIGAIPLLICAVYEMNRWLCERKDQVVRTVFLAGAGMLLVLFSLINLRWTGREYFHRQGGYVLSTNYSRAELEPVRALLDQYDAGTCVIAQKNDIYGGALADCLQLYDPENIYEEYDLAAGAFVTFDYYDHSVMTNRYTDRNLLLIHEADLSEMPRSVMKEYTEIGECMGYTVYLAEQMVLE